MDVLIVSKTHMTTAICVGGILADSRFVRLLDIDGHNQPLDTEFNIKDVWTIEFHEKTNKRPPHIEDILISKANFKFKLKEDARLLEVINQKFNITIWKGGIDNLFDGKLQWTEGDSGYISETGGIPKNSVGFWITDKELKRRDYKEKVRYSYLLSQSISGSFLHNQWRNISFVGFQEPIETIPSGTLVRVSLARWWSPDESEERCYLQLSGWYDIE